MVEYEPQGITKTTFMMLKPLNFFIYTIQSDNVHTLI